MSMLSSLPVLRWVVPAAAAAAVISGGAAIGTLTASADPDLPPRSAAELLVDVQSARLDGLSGTVVQQADLGLPALPASMTQGSSELTSLLAGKHTLRLWYAGPDTARVALIGTLGESDIIVNGRDVWVWSSQANSATHQTLPAPAGTVTGGSVPTPLASLSAGALTPQEAAEAALAAIDPSTVVSTGGSARVAGRDAYELILAPRDKQSLVGQVRLAIDATEHVPLRVEVYARGISDPSIKVAFTDINFDRPDPDQFTFNPPPGATVREGAAPSTGAGQLAAYGSQVALVGSGWTSVLAIRPAADGKSPATGATPLQDDQVKALMQMLPQVSGAWGSGRLLRGDLFSVLITDDGRVLLGAVSPERLYQAAADPAAALKKNG